MISWFMPGRSLRVQGVGLEKTLGFSHHLSRKKSAFLILMLSLLPLSTTMSQHSSQTGGEGEQVPESEASRCLQWRRPHLLHQDPLQAQELTRGLFLYSRCVGHDSVPLIPSLFGPHCWMDKYSSSISSSSG